MNADEKLINNLKEQVDRLVEELKDLEACKNDLDSEEYDSMKEEIVEQIKEFSETLDRMNKGNLSLNNELTMIRNSIRQAISSAFNTVDMIKLFGSHSIAELETNIKQIEEDFKLKKLSTDQYVPLKLDLLQQLTKMGGKVSEENEKFLANSGKEVFSWMEAVVDD